MLAQDETHELMCQNLQELPHLTPCAMCHNSVKGAAQHASYFFKGSSPWQFAVWARNDKTLLAGWIRGHVWKLACHETGTHFLQEVIKDIEPKRQTELAREIQGNINLAWNGQFARYSNYVIQGLIMYTPPPYIMFVAEDASH